MSAHFKTHISCDVPGCATTFGHDEDKINVQRREAKVEGWTYHNRGGVNMDFCPKHRPPRRKRVGNNKNGFKKGHPDYRKKKI